MTLNCCIEKVCICLPMSTAMKVLTRQNYHRRKLPIGSKTRNHIQDEDCKHGKNVRNAFRCKTLGDYQFNT